MPDTGDGYRAQRLRERRRPWEGDESGMMFECLVVCGCVLLFVG